MDFKNTLLTSLGIKIISSEKNKVVMTMPVDERTRQPAGFLHGGASLALAETAASYGATLHVDMNTTNIFGMEINANHVKSKKSGIVTATATPTHIGKRTMIWEIMIKDELEQLICISRCTIGVMNKMK